MHRRENRSLNGEHRDNPANGCFFPTLAAKVRHQSSPSRVEFGNASMAYFVRLARLLPKSVRKTHEDSELVLASGMVGAIVLARIVDDPARSDRILAACRNFYSATLGKPRSR